MNAQAFFYRLFLFSTVFHLKSALYVEVLKETLAVLCTGHIDSIGYLDVSTYSSDEAVFKPLHCKSTGLYIM